VTVSRCGLRVQYLSQASDVEVNKPVPRAHFSRTTSPDANFAARTPTGSSPVLRADVQGMRDHVKGYDWPLYRKPTICCWRTHDDRGAAVGKKKAPQTQLVAYHDRAASDDGCWPAAISKICW